MSLLRDWPRDAKGRSEAARRIFGAVAPRYDLFTRLLSFGGDARWKRDLAAAAVAGGSLRILDLATGTGAIPGALRRVGHAGPITGLDLCVPMLSAGARRLARAGVELVRGDLNRLPFRPESFDAITMAYGLRYLGDVRGSLAAILRLLRPGGVFLSLDFGIPDARFWRAAGAGYLLAAGTAWGLLLHGRPGTYHHIVESLRAYPGQGVVAGWMREAGFSDVRRSDRLGGITSLLTGRAAPAGQVAPASGVAVSTARQRYQLATLR